MACRGQDLVIRRERPGGDEASVSPERDPFFALAPGIIRGGLDAFFQELVDVPELGEIIHRRRGQSLAVGREGDAADPVPDLAPSCNNLLTGRDVPDPQRVVDAPGRHQLAVGRNGDAEDLACGALKRGLLFPLGHVPEPHGRIQILRELSTLPAATSLPSGETVTQRISLAVPSSVAFSFRSATSQSRTVVSMLPVTSILSSGENAMPRMPCSWPRSVASSCPVATSHNLAVKSLLPEARILLSWLNARDRTAPSCLRVARSLRVATSHSLMVLSWLPDATVFPSGAKARERIILAWPLSTASSCPETQSQSRTVPS